MFRVFFVLAFGLFMASCLGASLQANQRDSAGRRLFKRQLTLNGLNAQIHNLQHRVQYLTNRMNGATVHCFNKATKWDLKSDAPIMFLDRQNVDCPNPYFLARFQLGRAGDFNSANVRYNYRCCRFTV